jgi:hypothetical protein
MRLVLAWTGPFSGARALGTFGTGARALRAGLAGAKLGFGLGLEKM